ncbi:MAG: acetyltransferase [Acetivibrionales bacterium]
MKERLLIIGAGGHGKVVADIAIKMNRWKSIAFLDDNESKKVCMRLKVIGKLADALTYINDGDFFVAIGNNAAREKILKRLEAEGASIPSLVHPNAVIGAGVSLGSGTAVMAGVIINSSSKIGKGCIINTGSTIDHDSVIEDYVHISPGVKLAGTVKIGKGSWLGIGSIISNNVSICSDCIVGAGAVVVRDITEAGTYAGVPARRIN